MQKISKALLIHALSENNFTLSETAQEKLLAYLELLTKWNRVFNLTSITKPSDMVYLHLIDSLCLLPYLTGKHCLDVGTGAGLPGIPLAIADPQQKWTLLDKNAKKTRFLTQTIAELELPNVEIVNNKCEAYFPSQCFDTVLSRAYGSLNLFATSTAHLLCPQGMLLAMKGKYPIEELTAIPDEFEVQKIITLDIKGINIERHIICLRKRHGKSETINGR